MARNTHLMHGLRVRTDLPLHHARPAVGEPDLDLFTGLDRPIPDDAPRGTAVAMLRAQDRPLYTVTRHDAGYVLRFHRTCDVEISPDLRVARVHVDPTADRGLTAVVATGLLVSCVLMLRGHLVLHASAVDSGGETVAFVARSGHGKSTLATLAIAAGARFVTDDVLRIDSIAGRQHARLGATETRLRRPAAEACLPRDGSMRSRRTADGRSAVGVPLSELDPLPLAAVVLPVASRRASSITLTHLSPSEALISLSACPRVLGWSDPQTRGEQFTALAAMTATVPVLRAVLPWGPPFDPGMVRDLLDAVGVPLPVQEARGEGVLL